MENQKARLSDLILEALKRSMEQDNGPVSTLLTQALEKAMSPPPSMENKFIERRDYPEEIESAMHIFDAMKNDKGGGY